MTIAVLNWSYFEVEMAVMEEMVLCQGQLILNELKEREETLGDHTKIKRTDRSSGNTRTQEWRSHLHQVGEELLP